MMYVSDNNSNVLYIVMFYIKDPSSTDGWPYWILRSTEVFFMFVSLILTILTTYLAFHVRVYHFNISMFLSVFTMQWIEFAISRLLMAPYQEGWVDWKLPSSQHSMFIPTISNDIYYLDLSTHYPLVIGSFLKLRYMILVVFVLPCAAFERMMATILVRDYEKKRRAFISVLPLIISEILATSLAVMITFTSISPGVCALIALVFTILGYSCFLLVQIHTKKLVKKCEENVAFYSLSVKYQLAENIQLFKIGHIVIMEAMIFITAVTVAICIAYFNLISREQKIIIFIVLEYLSHINPLFISTAAIAVSPAWMRKLLGCIPGRINSTYRTTLESKIAKPPEHIATTALHFEQLQKSWMHS